VISTLNVALAAIAALAFWTCLGAALTRRLMPGTLALPLAPVVGWAVHSALALPLFEVVGFTQGIVVAAALAVLILRFALARRFPLLQLADMDPRVPRWAFAAAALLAIAPAVALLPKDVGDGVILAGPIFDHAKIAMIDEMARLGVPPGNPFFGDGEVSPRLVYYYLWHFSAAELALALGIKGWTAAAAMTWFTAFASLAAMMGLAVRFAARRAAAWWVVPLALAASLRPVLTWIFGADKVHAVLLPGTGFAGWLFQAAWVPQHLMSAAAIVAAVMLMGRLGERGLVRVIVVGLLVAAAFESSTWVGGVTFALAAPALGAALLWLAAPGERIALTVRLVAAAVIALAVSLPFVHQQLATAALHATGSPIVVEPYPVLGDVFSQGLRRILDLPAFWLVFLVVELPAISIAGLVALIAMLRRADGDRAVRCDAIALACLAAAGLVVAWLLVSTVGDNNDLGWRAALPAILALTAFAAAGLASWLAARAYVAVAAALLGIALGLPRSATIVRDDVAGHRQPDAAAFAQAPAMWAAVRRHAAEDERVGNNPHALAAVTPWPINIGWALLSNRRSCYAGPEFIKVFTALPPARRAEIDALFTRVFAGEGSPDDVRDLATVYGCSVIAVTAADGAWQHDPFAGSPFYRMLERSPDRWRIYRAIAPGNGEFRP
jgi:hypothetical protein